MDYLRWLNIIFPLSDDEKIIRDCDSKNFLLDLDVQYHRNMITLLPYQKPSVRAAIHLTKYHAHRKSIALLGVVLENFLSGFDLNKTVIIPTPLSQQRLKERGYNQVSLVAKRTKYQVSENIIYRHRHTAPQTSLRKSDRINNVAGAFSASSDLAVIKLVEDKHIILLDDVATTGSTLKAAKTPLANLSCRSVTCLALAH